MLLIVASVVIAAAGLGEGVLDRAVAQDATPEAVEAVNVAASGTNVRYLLPYTPDGLNPALTVTGHETGACDVSAAAADRPDAWRCISTAALDPCFENPFGAVDPPIELACLNSPWSRDVVLFSSTAPLPREKDPAAEQAEAPPWALELANGVRCDLITGATAVYAGLRLNYGCTGQGVVIGEPDRGDPLWTVSYLPPNGLATERVAVTVAWT
jgi:hypothetical protein